MKYKKSGNTYIIRLDRGEKIIESLNRFGTENKVKLGYFFGIGALDEAELAHYTVENKKYTAKKFSQPLEIISMLGNITAMDRKAYLHCHIALSDEKMRSIAGHLKEGRISATCEIFLVELIGSVSRKYDGITGLNLMEI